MDSLSQRSFQVVSHVGNVGAQFWYLSTPVQRMMVQRASELLPGLHVSPKARDPTVKWDDNGSIARSLVTSLEMSRGVHKGLASVDMSSWGKIRVYTWRLQILHVSYGPLLSLILMAAEKCPTPRWEIRAAPPVGKWACAVPSTSVQGSQKWPAAKRASTDDAQWILQNRRPSCCRPRSSYRQNS